MRSHGAASTRTIIHATCCINSSQHLRADFDATPWFEWASDAKIEALMRIGCAGDKEADSVARWTARHGSNTELQKLVKMCEPKPNQVNTLMLAARINRGAASVWIRQNRPELAARLDEQRLLSR